MFCSVAVLSTTTEIIEFFFFWKSLHCTWDGFRLYFTNHSKRLAIHKGLVSYEKLNFLSCYQV